jgi:tetratricopeptide (TPR) repeat protein
VYGSRVSKSAVYIAAAVCGAGVFVWTLANSPPERRQPRWTGGTPRTSMQMAPSVRPGPLEEVERRVQDEPANPAAWFDLAQRREALGDRSAMDAWGTVARLTEEAARNTGRGNPSFMHAWALDKLGEDDAAREAYTVAAARLESSIASNPANTVRRRLQLGWARARLGDAEAATRAWAEAARGLEAARPVEVEQWYELARLRAMLGEADRAGEALMEAAVLGYADAAWASADDYLAPARGSSKFRDAVEHMRRVRTTRDP